MNVRFLVLAIFVFKATFVYAKQSTTTACGGKPADVFFVLDSSGSIVLNDFRKELKFANDVTSMFDIGSSQTRVGVISFSKNVVPQFGLGEYDGKNDLMAKISDVSYQGLGTNTAEALSFIHEKGLSRDKVRPGVPHIAIILTDGMSQNPEDTLTQARLLHETGTTVFVIGIGNQVDSRELEAIGSKPSSEYVFEIDNFDALAKIKEELAIKACEVKPATPAPDIQSAEALVEQELMSFGTCTPRNKLDIVFAVDTASVGASNSRLVLQFIANLSDHINLESSESSIATVGNGCSGGMFTEEPSTNPKEVKAGLSTYDTPKFDAVMRSMRLKAADGRRSSEHIGIVFVADRLSSLEYRKSFMEMKRAQFQKIEFFVIAVGDKVDESQAKTLVTKGGELLRAKGFDHLEDIKGAVLYRLCVLETKK